MTNQDRDRHHTGQQGIILPFQRPVYATSNTGVERALARLHQRITAVRRDAEALCRLAQHMQDALLLRPEDGQALREELLAVRAHLADGLALLEEEARAVFGPSRYAAVIQAHFLHDESTVTLLLGLHEWHQSCQRQEAPSLQVMRWQVHLPGQLAALSRDLGVLLERLESVLAAVRAQADRSSER